VEDFGEGAGDGEGVVGEGSEGYLMATSLERIVDSMGQLLASLLAPDWERIKRWPI